MGSDLISLDPDYILDKWFKIIGTKPTQTTSPTRSIKVLDLLNSNWRSVWKVEEKKWNEIKQIIHFIRDFNSKNLFKPSKPNTFRECWGPDDLVHLYERWIGSSNLISLNEYNHIHTILLKQLDIYKMQNQREYNLTLLL